MAWLFNGFCVSLYFEYIKKRNAMNRKYWMIWAACLLLPLGINAQTFASMWKQVEAAQDKDLPQTALIQVRKIEAKATKENAYGQLLKATLLGARLQAEIAPDSLPVAVKRLEQQTANCRETALQAVYAATLAKIYRNNRTLEDYASKSDRYQAMALAHPEALAKVKADSYVPFVIKEKDSEVYSHDLLSIVGQELEVWQWMADYYESVGNCRAACLAIVNVPQSVESADSLLNVYGDYDEACELAIRRYEMMSDKRFTAADKYQWLQQALKRWGKWKRANVLRNHLTELTNPQFSAYVERRVQEISKSQTVALKELRNINQLTMRVYRTQLQGDTKLNPNDKDDYKKMKAGLAELTEMTKTISFSGHAVYDIFTDSLQLQGLPAGVYLLEFASQPQTEVSRQLYFVSGIRILQQVQPDNSRRFVVVDATTGQPVKNASIRLSFRKNWNSPETTRVLTCNSQGEAVYTGEQRPATVFAYTANDNYCQTQNASGAYSYYERQYNNEHTNLFTDRAIYRPGQTVYATAIAWKELSALENAAVSGKVVTFELRDANYKLVAEQQATTDRFGKCSVQFTLPKGQLNGRYSIRAKNGSVSFRVEEYKRPAFQVEFDDYKESYQAGDTIHAKAKATSYAGVPIQDAKVHYTVKRRVAFWWMSYSRYWQAGYFGDGLREIIISEGDTQTTDDGSFAIDMPLTMPDDLGHHTMFYHFVVDADVTDQAGETHHGTMSLPLGNKATSLTCNIPEKVRNDQLPTITFTRRNAAGKEIPGKLRYRIDGGKWQEASANCPLSIVNDQLKSGKHRLEAICAKDSIDQQFVVFSLTDKRPATETHDWFYVSDVQFPTDGSPVTMQVGSSDPNTYIVYSIFAGRQKIEEGAVKRNGELINRQFSYREEYGNGLLLTFAWMKNGECYRHQQVIRRPMPDKKLKMQWTTFRDRLTPGQQEQWQLTIKKPDGAAADASFMAVLYDKSLDALTSHQWSFTPSSYLPQPSTNWGYASFGHVRATAIKEMKFMDVNELLFSRFDESIFPVYYRSIRVRGRNVLMKANAAVPAAMAVEDTRVYDHVEEVQSAKEEVVAVGYGVKGQDADAAEEEQVQVRENLNETAFCYPTLQTDGDGNVSMSFSLPESLTTWRFMGIANTADMLYGYIDGEAIAQKDVMIQPNMPRFVRDGDETTISARLFNTTDHSVSGTAKLQLIDPETNKVIYEMSSPFAIDANGSTSAHYKLWIVKPESSLFICKVTAQGDGFSDGEQHYLPVLSNREYVTKTISYTQHEAGVKTIDLQKLFPQGTSQKKLTIEYTNNPAWLMVQSLPTLGQPWEHSAIDQAASYYSNLLAKTLMQQSPQAKATFEQWRRETGNETTLMSQLEKNQELKDLLLEETPWVAAADRESEQRQRIADFFDENGINNRLATTTEKLKKLQNADGSFSWYPGMEGSTYITVAIEEMLVRLNVMAGQQKDIKQIHQKAFDYLSKEMTDLVARMKKEEKKGHRQTFPSITALRWLYLCALDGQKLSASVKSANDYLIGLLKKDIKRQTIYEKAMTAVVLSKRGEQTKAAEYVKSLKEYTVYTEEMGRYYDTRKASYSWYDYKIPTEVAAIEAIQLVTPTDKQTVDEMRRWLLQEKRTQVWNTPINSVNAIYAFLNGHSSTLTTSQPATTLAVDGVSVDTGKGSAGIGYVKNARAYKDEHTFTATKTSEGTSWGAVYAQFLQKTSDIEASGSGISVRRELLDAGDLKVGQRIRVRITIEAERDLDFVEVVDRRASCMEPIRQLSGYQQGAYVSPKDNATHYFYRGLSKGKHVIETTYYIDRAGQYNTGTCTVGCAYAPEYRATAPSMELRVNE